MLTTPSSKTNWAKIHAKSDADIDLSDAPETTAEFWATATPEPPVSGPHSFRTDPLTGKETTTSWRGEVPDATIHAVQVPPGSPNASSSVISVAHLTLDPAIFDWFRARSDNPIQGINDALRHFIQSQPKDVPLK